MSPETATFCKEAAADVVFTLTADAPLVKVTNGTATVNSSNYSYDATNHTMTIKDDYLTTLTNGDKAFKFYFGDDEYLSATITVTTGNAITPTTATFDKADPADVTFTITPDGEETTVSAVKNGTTALTESDYTFADGTLTITDDYLAALENGDVVLTVTMSALNAVSVTITVSGEASEE